MTFDEVKLGDILRLESDSYIVEGKTTSGTFIFLGDHCEIPIKGRLIILRNVSYRFKAQTEEEFNKTNWSLIKSGR